MAQSLIVLGGTVKVTVPPKMLKLDDATKIGLNEHLAREAMGMIRRRTKAGLNMTGQPFRAYSQPYARQRDRAGWQTKPDLWLTGQMLGSMSVLRVDATAALLGFAGSGLATKFKKSKGRTSKRTGKRLTGTLSTTTRTVTNAQKALWNQKLRPFFGLTSDERKALAREAQRLLTVK